MAMTMAKPSNSSKFSSEDPSNNISVSDTEGEEREENVVVEHGEKSTQEIKSDSKIVEENFAFPISAEDMEATVVLEEVEKVDLHEENQAKTTMISDQDTRNFREDEDGCFREEIRD
ncbi:uncharacterized protein A4U43_C07F6280 [Asparagus officinalis]|uniref:Uncharacterized protein n=1 Tax=Asparagus officinalis TaxID=4686 RepID=A0A5P1ECX5_ASPOF|nr:uncharacterized protein A4U43_C07F6280 [Asparagus officinalis]